jgi:NarL family two-component system response regulator LiaR
VDRISVLIADDHPVVREGLRTFLSLQDDLDVAGEAADGEEAVAKVGELLPDVVVLDLVMPKLDGLGVLRALRTRVPAARVVVLTSFLDDDKLLPALRGGAAGYLLKNAEPQAVADAIRTVKGGEALLHPSVAARLMQEVAERDESPAADLTDRELDVLRLLARGLSNKAIALELYVSEKTVKTHVSNILAKLHLADRTQAALFAVRERIVPE